MVYLHSTNVTPKLVIRTYKVARHLTEALIPHSWRRQGMRHDGILHSLSNMSILKVSDSMAPLVFSFITFTGHVRCVDAPFDHLINVVAP